MYICRQQRKNRTILPCVCMLCVNSSKYVMGGRSVSSRVRTVDTYSDIYMLCMRVNKITITRSYAHRNVFWFITMMMQSLCSGQSEQLISKCLKYVWMSCLTLQDCFLSAFLVVQTTSGKPQHECASIFC